ncbi:MAG: antitoxin [Acidimicrobiales bacterium]|nr:antitoxin [Acidimicrobiales bacterium]
MALMRSLRRLTRYAPKAKQVAESNAGKIAENVNKATGFVDEKTKGRYTDKLDKVDAKANEFAVRQGQAPAGGGGSTTGTDTGTTAGTTGETSSSGDAGTTDTEGDEHAGDDRKTG